MEVRIAVFGSNNVVVWEAPRIVEVSIHFGLDTCVKAREWNTHRQDDSFDAEKLDSFHHGDIMARANLDTLPYERFPRTIVSR